MKPRGIIIAPSIEYGSTRKERRCEDAEANHLRKCVLYWDYIEVPLPPSHREATEREDLAILMQEGILQPVFFNLLATTATDETLREDMVYWLYPQMFMEIVRIARLERHKNDNTIWTIGRTQASMADHRIEIVKFVSIDIDAETDEPTFQYREWSGQKIIADQMASGASIELALNHALPVPSADVPIEKIIAFKQKRHSELLRFRHAWDGIILDVQKAPDPLRAIEYHKDSIEFALSDLHRVMNEASLKTLMRSVTGVVSIDPLALAKTVVTALVQHHVGLDPLGVVVSGVGAALSSKLNLSSLKPKEIPSELKDYEYLYHVEKEWSTR